MLRTRVRVLLVSPFFSVFLWGCTTHPKPQVAYPSLNLEPFVQEGLASWYGPGFHGRRTASGERFNQRDLTCAHRTLPFGTKLKVTNLRNGQELILTVNDRGPYVRNRIVDVSREAARQLDFLHQGTTRVRVETFPSVEVASPLEAMNLEISEVDPD